MTQQAKPSFFMRFYDRSDDDIAQCMREVASGTPIAFEWAQVTPDGSVNFAAAGRQLKQVQLYFASEADRDAVKGSAAAQAVYERWAAPADVQGRFTERRPGDPLETHVGVPNGATRLFSGRKAMEALLRQAGAQALEAIPTPSAPPIDWQPGETKRYLPELNVTVSRGRRAEPAPLAAPAARRPRQRG